MSVLSRILNFTLGLMCCFLPCYILDASEWKELESSAIKNAYGNFAWKTGSLLGVRRTLLYTPAEKEDKRPIVIFVVHGTFAADSEDYYHNAQYFFPDVQNYAKGLALQEKVPVKLIFYRWSGHENQEHRCEAGKHLSVLINKHKDYKIITIAHSHGGNVVNYASNCISGMIDLMVHFAVPVIPDNAFYRPNNFGILCNFYSMSDLVQLLGATDAHKSMRGALKMWQIPVEKLRNYHLSNVKRPGRILNLCTQINGYDADHTDIKYAVAALPQILEIISEHYILHNDFYLNVDLRQHDREEQVILALKESKRGILEKFYEVERAYSNKQKEIYKQLYKVEINRLRPHLNHYSSVLVNTLLLMPRMREWCAYYKFFKEAPLMQPQSVQKV